MNFHILKFFYSEDGIKWTDIGCEFDATILSDENCRNGMGFTGAFVGMCCQDLLLSEKPADFQYFEYEEALPDCLE